MVVTAMRGLSRRRPLANSREIARSGHLWKDNQQRRPSIHVTTLSAGWDFVRLLRPDGLRRNNQKKVDDTGNHRDRLTAIFVIRQDRIDRGMVRRRFARLRRS